MSSFENSSSYIKQITQWFTSAGGTIHPAVEIIYNAPYAGYSLRVRASQYLPSGSRVISCPHNLVLSILSIHRAENPWPTEFLSHWSHSPEVLTRVFLMEQLLLAEEGFWYPYIRMLPQPGEGGLDTPLFYGEEDCVWIKGTNLEGAREVRERAWRGEWEECVRLLGKWDGERGPLLAGRWELYKWAATILTSRCFSSAAFAMHGLDQQDTTSINDGDEGIKGPTPSAARFPILLPVFDIANHDPAANVTWGWENSACSFTVTRDIPASKEICISYDNKSNEELILGYGFSLFRNPQDAYGLVLKNLSSSKNIARAMEAQRDLHNDTDDSPRELTAIPTTFFLRAADGRHFFAANPRLTDIFSILVANRRELETVKISSDRCWIPHNATHHLTHNAVKTATTLLTELDRKHAAITAHDCSLPPFPENNRQFHGARYRRSQLHILHSNILSLARLLRTANSETTHLVRLEDLLAPSTPERPNQLRKAVHRVLGTRNARRIREEGWGELVFTLWICASWLSGSKGQTLGTSVDRFVTGPRGWVESMVDIYGTPAGGGKVGSEVGKAGDVVGRAGYEEECVGEEGETEDEKRAIAESYLDVVRAGKERFPGGVFAEEGWGVEMLVWGRRVVLEEGLVLSGMGEGEENQFVVFVGGDVGE
ncbi:hypothetical protein MMC30_007390 [Trapelia coarctata]|nr:hypothetical protein [Trapelia coarctata]